MADDHAAGYDFVKLGEGLTRALLTAAQEQVSKANQILEQTQSMTDIIMTQVRAQAKQIEDMNVRFKAFGEQMLDAHRILNGGPSAAPVSDIARLPSAGDLRISRAGTPGIIGDAHRVRDNLPLARESRAADPARQRDLQREVAASEPAGFRAVPREDRIHPGSTGSDDHNAS